MERLVPLLFRFNENLILGQYLVPWARIGTPLAHTQDPQQGVELWNWLEEQVHNI